MDLRSHRCNGRRLNSSLGNSPLMNKDTNKKLQDAQAFLQDIKAFNKEKTEELQVSLVTTFQTSENIVPSDDPLPTLRFTPFVTNSNNPSDFTTATQAFRADVITFIEVYFHTHHTLPSLRNLHDAFQDHTHCPKLVKDWKDILDTVSESLSNRGLRTYNTTENYLDPRFIFASSSICNILDKRTQAAKLKESGLSTKEWYKLLRIKKYFTYFEQRLDEVFDEDTRNNSKLAIAKLVDAGDLQAIKYYNELKNIYRPESQSANQLISIVLTAVMEILATHVSSEILSRIASEIRNSPSVIKVINTQSKENIALESKGK